MRQAPFLICIPISNPACVPGPSELIANLGIKFTQALPSRMFHVLAPNMMCASPRDWQRAEYCRRHDSRRFSVITYNDTRCEIQSSGRLLALS